MTTQFYDNVLISFNPSYNNFLTKNPQNDVKLASILFLTLPLKTGVLFLDCKFMLLQIHIILVLELIR